MDQFIFPLCFLTLFVFSHQFHFDPLFVPSHFSNFHEFFKTLFSPKILRENLPISYDGSSFSDKHPAAHRIIHLNDPPSTSLRDPGPQPRPTLEEENFPSFSNDHELIPFAYDYPFGGSLGFERPYPPLFTPELYPNNEMGYAFPKINYFAKPWYPPLTSIPTKAPSSNGFLKPLTIYDDQNEGDEEDSEDSEQEQFSDEDLRPPSRFPVASHGLKENYISSEESDSKESSEMRDSNIRSMLLSRNFPKIGRIKNYDSIDHLRRPRK